MSAEKLFSLIKEGERINFHVKDSNKFIGYAYREVDGYYVFVFDGKSDGAWPDYALLEIGNELKELNKDWDKELRNALKK